MYNYSKQIFVPMLTNSVALRRGEELILELSVQKKGPKETTGPQKRRFSEVQKTRDATSGKKR